MPDKQDLDARLGPAGGWGSVKSISKQFGRAVSGPVTATIMRNQNKPGGFACVSCAWAKPAKPHPFEFCENGAKATLWELTDARADAAFFERHPLSELLTWSDHDLERAGRLTVPLRVDPAADRLVPSTWDEAFEDIGREMRALSDPPQSAIFYASGRASLEASYMWQLMARLYGSSNLPDSANMCHESTSIGLKESVGTPVGSVRLEDFELTDCIFAVGQNVGSNSPRMMHPLQKARQRGVPVIVINPMRERGWEEFVNPQNPVQMLTQRATKMSSLYLQPLPGGDIAAIAGIIKAVYERSDVGEVVDRDFITEHTHGYEGFVDWIKLQSWDELERESGLTREQMQDAGDIFARSRRVMGIYGMGLTQHRLGVQAVQMLINLLLIGGHIGRPGAGICPVRGHSNVQGQRTVGISSRPEQVPLDRIGERYGFQPSKEEGYEIADGCEDIVSGKVRAIISLGGNLLRAVPDQVPVEAAWRNLDVTVNVATKLNRTHLIAGRCAWVLPCLGRIENDVQATGKQVVTMEDSTARIHASHGQKPPAAPNLMSEPAIIARLAREILPPNPRVDWDAWAGNYALVRAEIEAIWPDVFRDYEARLDEPGGFDKPLPSRERKWETKTGLANFILPDALDATFAGHGDGVFRLMTLRSNDQFNTTVYGNNDRFRGVKGARDILFMGPDDMARMSLKVGDRVEVQTVSDDDKDRRLGPLQVVEHPLPKGAVGAYFPEANVLMPLHHYAVDSKTPAYKAIPVRVVPSQMAAE